jgi:hypothetical protein
MLFEIYAPRLRRLQINRYRVANDHRKRALAGMINFLDWRGSRCHINPPAEDKASIRWNHRNDSNAEPRIKYNDSTKMPTREDAIYIHIRLFAKRTRRLTKIPDLLSEFLDKEIARPACKTPCITTILPTQ